MVESTFDDAIHERERQRSESEARAIIHDLGKLYTFDEEKKSRWIWELLQNAKDVACADGIDVVIKLSKNELTFSHNGLPFKTTNLLALLYKTSTKSLSGEGGTTGKYGTGFVTTHILSRKLEIDGVHENSSGKRRFNLTIDRVIPSSHDAHSALSAMQKRLADTFLVIDEISKKPAETVQSLWNSFIYPLDHETYIYAERGIRELERNVAFTLLINSRINSITVKTEHYRKEYQAKPEKTQLPDISFLSIASESGILFTRTDRLTIAISAKKVGDNFTLLPIEKQAILYKEFPLIGTENFNLPVFIQHVDFQPTEQRDGIRSKKMSEDDLEAEKNRTALIEFVNFYLKFIETLINGQAINLHLFAKSGLPEYVEKFSTVEWYQTSIQSPIRNFIKKQDIVRTAKGVFKKIEEVRFPSIELSRNEEFYSLLSELVPDIVPDKDSVWSWCETISQESSEWPTAISINEEDLVKLVPINVRAEEPSGIKLLKSFYAYLEANNISSLGERYPIYLSEANCFCLRDSLSIHPDIDNEFKVVSGGLGRSLNEEFLNRKLGVIAAIKEFDLKEFYVHLNKEMISELKIENAHTEQICAIFHVCTLFRSERSSKREKWHQIIRRLLPDIVGDKKLVSVDYDNYWRSAEIWSIKYICRLIEKSQRPTLFATQYFQADTASCFEWLKEFLMYIFQLEDDNTAVFFKNAIIPTQADLFKPYDDFIFSEDEYRLFDDNIKNIYRDYTGKGDPRRFIIAREVYFDGLRMRDIGVLTDEIDKLFQVANIESKVKVGGGYNQMFLQLNDWFEKVPNAINLLRTFGANRASLYVLALGEGFSKQVMEMKSTGRTIDEITELARITLTNQEIKQFERAAEFLGAERLLAKAQEMLEAQKQVERWKIIGGAAECAFEEVIQGLDLRMTIENPDRGRDFDLILNSKGYYIEIKSVAEGKENVRMSMLQGRTAVQEKENYALCVITRTNDETPVNKDYFTENARFVIDIGEQIGDKIQNWDKGLMTLQHQSDIKVMLEDKVESIYINRSIWRPGLPFNEFVLELKKFAEKHADN